MKLTTESEIKIKTKKQVSKETAFNEDNDGKRIKDYELRVCTWNIRTLNRDGASAKQAETLTECGADITAIQEIRWIGQECKIRQNCNINYSWHAEKREFVCGFVVDQSLRHLVLGFTPVNERVAKIRIKAKFHKVPWFACMPPWFWCLYHPPR